MYAFSTRTRFACRFVVACAALVFPRPCSLLADVPVEPAARLAIVGQPSGLVVLPATVLLNDQRARQQLVVTGQYPGGALRDLTQLGTYRIEATDIAMVDASGVVTPLKDGTTALIIQAGSQSARIPVVVKDLAKPRPVSFRRDVIASFNVGGCNMGACHGTPSGKNGFRLSLRGYDPDSDYIQLTRDILGRRTDALNPDESLILQKGGGRMPHEGGQRFSVDALPYQLIRGWIAEGLQEDAKTLPALTKVEILPGDRVQVHPAQWQQLAVMAHYADGTVRDVTLLSVFSSSDPAVADVSRTGFVEFKQQGETAVLVRYLENMLTVHLTYLKPNDKFVWSNPAENNFIDKLVFAKLKMLNILPSDLCTDQEFLRRAYLDLCGILPTGAETQTFLSSTAPDKRSKLIDQLLERPEYADFWTLKWCDVLRSNRKTMQVAGVYKFQEWVHNSLSANRPFDEMVRELLTSSGSTFANPAANYYRVARDPQSLAETTAQLFLGARMQCAKCHNHPFERWTQDDYYSLAAFFARVKQKRDPDNESVPNQPGAELIFLDRAGEVTQPRSGKQMTPKYPGGSTATLTAEQDRRSALAEWLTAPNNPFLPRSVANRIWFHLLGRGIVDPVDDFRDSNPPCNEDLLTALAREFVDDKFDQKRLIRLIMKSRTYQLSAQANNFNRDDIKYFSHAVTKLHTAEQLLDGICAATAVPEKFAGLPLGTRASQLPDGEVNHVFLKTFGQPARELACECERESDSNLAQALQLINGPTIHEKLRSPNNRIGQLMGQKKAEADILNELYMATLSRTPTASETKAVMDHVTKASDKRKAWEDVQWALINSKEFLFRH